MIGQIEIPGEPIPLSRARAGKHGFYDPQCLVKSNIVDYVIKIFGKQKPATNPIWMNLTFYMPIPKGTPKKHLPSMPGKPHSKRPDLDNFVKFIFDTFNKVLWEDDCLIYSLDAVKLYDVEPKTIITFNEWKSSYD